MNNEERLDSLEAQMREHTHSVLDGTSRLEDGKTIIQSLTDSATVTPREKDDFVDVTALAQALTIANPQGNANNFDKLLIRIKDNGTGRALTFGSLYSAGGPALPTTTVATKGMKLLFLYNETLTKWELVARSETP